MKNIRFYLEYESPKMKRANKNTGNVIAVITNAHHQGKPMSDAIGAVYDTPDSPVCSTSVHWEYLREKCKRISEDIARIIHPNLFNYLQA